MKNELILKEIDKVFTERITLSNIFIENEIIHINENRTLFEKCYLLGVIDSKNNNK